MINRFVEASFKILLLFFSLGVLCAQVKPLRNGWDRDFFFVGQISEEGILETNENSIGVALKSAGEVELGGLLKVVFETDKSVKGIEMFLVSPAELKDYTLRSLKIYFEGKPLKYLLRSYGFRVGKKLFSRIGKGNGEVWMILLGIPSFFKSGDYKIILKVRNDKGIFFYVSNLKIKYRHFRFEKLALNSHLTALKESKDPLIFEQTRELIKILRSFDREKVFYIQKFLPPVKAVRVTSSFGERREYDYLDGKKERRIHNGIDYAVPVGTPVKACGDGEVVFSGDRIITGKSIVLEHMPGVFSIYYHLSKLVVKRGDVVKRGTVIGYSGMSGFATGPHLHWEIRVSGVAVDPKCFLQENLIDKTLFMNNIKKP